MSYKIVVDSCCDLTEELKQSGVFQIIPLTLQVGEKFIADDETFDQAAFLKAVRECPDCPKSACPSPEQYKTAYEGDGDMIFVVTLSQHLSGSYNSAVLAKNLYIEEHGEDKQIHVFSSDSAACGESLIAMKLRELADQGKTFGEIVEEAEYFRDHMLTYFVLETLDSLKKNGRLTGVQAILATALNIKPLMAGDHGVIVKLDQARGIQKALGKLVQHLSNSVKDPENKILGISHCNCPERAEYIKEQLCKLVKFKDVYIAEAAGVTSLYASDGGVVVSV